MKSEELFAKQRTYFAEGHTRSYANRIEALTNLKKMVLEYSDRFAEALYADLGKTAYESYMSETGIVLHEISYAMSHLRRWMKPRRVLPSLAQMPASSLILSEPLGVVLVMAPWNYPVQLNLVPLVAAIAAGNCAILKPSAYAPNVSQVITTAISSTFKMEYISVVQGGRVANANLLELPFDHIFFTGSTTVGKVVMEAAAKNLVPVTLELGGKSPVIIDRNASIEKAAKSIVFGKLINTGQTCIAPDYILVHSSCKQPLVEALKRQITLAMGSDILHNPEYPKIITKEKLDHLVGLLEGCTILHGGSHSQNRLEPTLVDIENNQEHPLMQEEIFGPILPILEFDEIEDAADYVAKRPKPLAFYLFTNDRTLAKRMIAKISFGGGCINDTIMHIGNPRMPFGGVGYSGMGAYHGKTGFDTFSHRKSILRKSLLFDVPMRYHPYKPQYMKMIKRFLH